MMSRDIHGDCYIEDVLELKLYMHILVSEKIKDFQSTNNYNWSIFCVTPSTKDEHHPLRSVFRVHRKKYNFLTTLLQFLYDT